MAEDESKVPGIGLDDAIEAPRAVAVGGSCGYGHRPASVRRLRLLVMSHPPPVPEVRATSRATGASATAHVEHRSGLVNPGSGMGSSSVTGWEEFGRSHPARTAVNLAQPS